MLPRPDKTQGNVARPAPGRKGGDFLQPRRLALWLLLCLAGLSLAWLPATSPTEAQTNAQTNTLASYSKVALLEIEGPIGPATADYVGRGIETAEARGAALIVLRLNTPGGLVTSMRSIIEAILASDVPVAGYVSPSGGHAASAGTYILYATHIAAMAPGTTIGAATPVTMGAPGMPSPPQQPAPQQPAPQQPAPQQPAPDGTAPAENDAAGEGAKETDGGIGDLLRPKPGIEDKALNDAIAQIRSLAQLRGRNIDWAEKAVREAATLTASEALEQNVIEIVATSLDDLIAAIGEREVVLNGGTVTLSLGAVEYDRIEPDWRTEFLSIITNPNVAYILMLLGIYGLFFELYNPGMIFPGVIGAICLLLALYAFQVLPVNYAGLALVLLGLSLIVAETFVPSFGILGIGGVVAFVVGSLMLMRTDVPGFGISMGLIGSVAFLAAGGLLLLALFFMRARQRAVETGWEMMIGATGIITEWAGNEGRIKVKGEDWAARSETPFERGARAEVTYVDGLTLEIVPAAPKHLHHEPRLQ